MELEEEKLYIWGNIKDEEILLCPIETSIVLFVLNYCENKDICCCVVNKSDDTSDKSIHRFPIGCLHNIEVLSKTPEDVERCTLPAIQKACMVRAGLCAVLRHIIKTSDQRFPQRGLLKLLGYKGICLKSCAEVSVWTKFCEVEIPQCVECILGEKGLETESLDVPRELLKLENHFGQPAIIPNISKRKRQAVKRLKQQNVEVALETVDKKGELEHIYAEGTDMTLTDLILYPCVTCFLNQSKAGLCRLQETLPRVLAWYGRLQRCPLIKQASQTCGYPWIDLPQYTPGQYTKPHLDGPDPQQSSLDVRDPNKKKFKTHSAQIGQVMDKLESCGVEPTEGIHPCGIDVKLPWDQMPPAVNPAEGDLPSSRVARKCEQLENLARAVVHVAKAGQVIVDFCAGGGHLGILLAHLLPSCQVILVENKEESILRAEKRIQALGLSNIMLYQCNMDYFVGTFDIGVCLHACGVATDLVLQRCLDNQAAFVICPCCYGGIQNTHTMQYPRSGSFKQKSITYQDYLVLGHAADQTQVGIKQAADGKKCMLLIDTDRAASAREQGYRVTLCSLQPTSCSPKNDLLIGVLDR